MKKVTELSQHRPDTIPLIDRQAYISRIRAEAGRKGGLTKAKNARSTQRSKPKQAAIDPAPIVQAIEKLCSKIDRLVDVVTESQKAANPPPPERPRFKPAKREVVVVNQSNIVSKRNILKGLADSNSKKCSNGGPFDAILRENRELDRLAKLGKK